VRWQTPSWSPVIPELRIRPSYANLPHLKLIFSFSVYSFLLQIFAYLILYTDSVVIALFFRSTSSRFLPLRAI